MSHSLDLPYSAESLPGEVIIGWDTLFHIPLLAVWNKIGEYRQDETECNISCKHRMQVDWDHKVGDKVLLWRTESSANQKVGINLIIGLSSQFIQLGKIGINVNLIRTIKHYKSHHLL